MKAKLMDRGVILPDPGSVWVADDVDPNRIHAGAVIHPGCRVSGASTAIGPDCVIGAESPVTLCNAQLGRGVVISGGFVEGATLLDGARAGDGFHARPGTLMEEGANVAHTVGLKQTVLMPWVTLGSLINFCDVLMAGGTGSHDHSEVGSSYVHFNFTPHQDKATASLVGDVPQGVLLNQPPIFLGGQGGLVGPRRIAFGTVVAAGTVLRRNVLETNQLATGAPEGSGLRLRPYNPVCYGRVDEALETCRLYLGNLLALRAWYAFVRAPVLAQTPWGEACLAGARVRLAEGWKERIKRLDQLAEKLAASVAAAGDRADSLVFVGQRGFVERWPTAREALNALAAQAFAPEGAAAAVVTRLVAAAGAAGHLAAVQALADDDRRVLAAWLETIVSSVTATGRW